MQLQSMRMRWAAALASRGMNAEGYVHTHQHDGLAHAEGWPFPLWTQAGGIGWHFRGTGVPGYDGPPATPEGWTLTGASGTTVGAKGWEIELTEPQSAIQTPAFAVAARTAPWLRLNWWAAGMAGANCYVEWTTQDEPEFSSQRRAYFSPATSDGQSHSYMPMGGGGGKLDTDVVETRTMIPVYRLPAWKGTITGIRIGFGNAGPARWSSSRFTRPVTAGTTSTTRTSFAAATTISCGRRTTRFLRDQIGRIRSAMRFMMREFDTRNRRCVYTTWPGHEGAVVSATWMGRRRSCRARVWGATIGTCCPSAAKMRWARSTTTMRCWTWPSWRNRSWRIPSGVWPPAPMRSIREDLRRHAQEVKDYGTQRFWNPQTGRFGTVDLDGNLHDYGSRF